LDWSAYPTYIAITAPKAAAIKAPSLFIGIARLAAAFEVFEDFTTAVVVPAAAAAATNVAVCVVVIVVVAFAPVPDAVEVTTTVLVLQPLV
jgi:hypothetical protein